MSYDENKIMNYMSEIKKIEEMNSIKECSLFDITFDNGIIKNMMQKLEMIYIVMQ